MQKQVKEKPYPGHKSAGMRFCHRAYCECGWSGEAHWERREAWGEWREHVRTHKIRDGVLPDPLAYVR